MKNLIFLTFLVFFVVSCGNKEVKIDKSEVKSEVNVDSNKQVLKEAIPHINNPVLFGGSNSGFGGYINILYKMGKYDEMINFTSKVSLEKFGKESVKEFYQNKLKFGFELGSVKSLSEEDGVKVINYPNASVMPTRKEGKTVRIAYVIENDSCKLVLTDLTEGFFK